MTNRYYHGTRSELALHDLVAPVRLAADDPNGQAGAQVLLTPNLDEAIWSAELADGDAPPRVYVVEPLGARARLAQSQGTRRPGIPPCPGAPTNHCASRPKSPTGSITTDARRPPPRRPAPAGPRLELRRRRQNRNHVYFTRTLDAAAWAQSSPLARDAAASTSSSRPVRSRMTPTSRTGGSGQSHQIIPFPRTTADHGPAREWRGHAPEAIAAMKGGPGTAQAGR